MPSNYVKLNNEANIKENYTQMITDFIKQNYDVKNPILSSDLYKQFPKIKKGSIRQVLNRLVEKEVIKRADRGIYFIPDTKRGYISNLISTKKIIESKYIEENKRVGYKSGIYFANQLGLTRQIAAVESIISNNVSNKKRKVNINKGRIIVDAPKVEINESNYKLLQVLDLLSNFEKWSEVGLDEATPAILDYLKDIKMSKIEIEKCIESYPLQAQVYFYKTGAYHELIK